MEFEKRMTSSGYPVRIISIEHLKDIRSEIFQNYTDGDIDTNLFKWLTGFYKFDPPDWEVPARSLVITASGTPQVIAVFCSNGVEYTFVIPPTYLDFLSEPPIIKRQLERASGGKFRFEEATNLPNKLLAGKSGLCKYGRNNLCYISGMGSYILLTVFYSTMPCGKDNLLELQNMESCSNCGLCVKNCPTGALRSDRFALRAERCVTYHNEFWGKPQFPEWLPTKAHNCLVGCLRCQTVCPENKGLMSTYEKVLVFTEEETCEILLERPFELLPDTLTDKLKSINLHIHYGYLSRNLAALLPTR